MNESSFIRTVHMHMSPEVKLWKIKDDYQGGVSDALYFGSEGRLLFVEYKYLNDLPVRMNTMAFVRNAKGLSTLQFNWYKDLRERGIPVCGVFGAEVNCKRMAVLVEEEENICGISVKDYLERMIPVKDMAIEIYRRVFG